MFNRMKNKLATGSAFCAMMLASSPLMAQGTVDAAAEATAATTTLSTVFGTIFALVIGIAIAWKVVKWLKPA